MVPAAILFVARHGPRAGRLPPIGCTKRAFRGRRDPGSIASSRRSTRYWYGSPLNSGYGTLGAALLRREPVAEPHALFALAGRVTDADHPAGRGRLCFSASARRAAAGLLACSRWRCSPATSSTFPFDAWWFLRFLLPAYPGAAGADGGRPGGSWRGGCPAPLRVVDGDRRLRGGGRDHTIGYAAGARDLRHGWRAEVRHHRPLRRGAPAAQRGDLLPSSTAAASAITAAARPSASDRSRPTISMARSPNCSDSAIARISSSRTGKRSRSAASSLGAACCRRARRGPRDGAAARPRPHLPAREITSFPS